jgi:hypothetical protein
VPRAAARYYTYFPGPRATSINNSSQIFSHSPQLALLGQEDAFQAFINKRVRIINEFFHRHPQ